MSLSVRLAPAAERDLERLAEFLVSKNPRAALRAADAITEVALSLADFPERGRPGPQPEWRELGVRYGRDGYVIRYRVTETGVFISRVFHARELR